MFVPDGGNLTEEPRYHPNTRSPSQPELWPLWMNPVQLLVLLWAHEVTPSLLNVPFTGVFIHVSWGVTLAAFTWSKRFWTLLHLSLSSALQGGHIGFWGQSQQKPDSGPFCRCSGVSRLSPPGPVAFSSLTRFNTPKSNSGSLSEPLQNFRTCRGASWTISPSCVEQHLKGGARRNWNGPFPWPATENQSKAPEGTLGLSGSLFGLRNVHQLL